MAQVHTEKMNELGVSGTDFQTLDLIHYDARARLVETDYPDGTSVKNSYDGPGNLASVTDQAQNVVQYTYDAANQLKTVIQVNHPNPSNNTSLYGYNPLGNPSQPGLVWTPSDPDRNQTMVFDNNCRMVDDPEREARKILLG